MKTRMTLTIGPKSKLTLAKLARKLSIETSTAWDSQEVLKRLVNIGMKHSMTAYYPTEKVHDIGA